MDFTYLESLSDEALEGVAAQMQALEQSVSAIKLAAVAELDARAAYKRDYMPSMSGWLSATFCVKEQTAKNQLRIANALAGLPAIRDAYAEGALSFDQVNALTRYATSETDAQLAKQTVGVSPFLLEREACRHRSVTAEDAQTRRDQRRFRRRVDREAGIVDTHIRLPVDEDAVLMKALDLRSARQPKDPLTGVFESYEKRLCDSLVELAHQSLATETRPERAMVVFHVNEGQVSGRPGYAELENGAQVCIETVERHLCEARVEYAIHDDVTGRTIGLARPSAAVPAGVERDVRRRDLTCQFPGCDRAGMLHLHHAIPKAEGGKPVATNLPLVCGPHHRYLHEYHWRVRWVDEGWQWVRPDGRVHNPAPETLHPDVQRWIFRPDTS